MSRLAAVLLSALVLPGAFAAAPDPALTHARALLKSAILIDGHNDLPWEIREDEKTPMDVEAYDLRRPARGKTDIARLKQGQLRGQFWSIFIPGELKDGYARTQLEQFDIARRMIARYPEAMELALSAADVRRIAAKGKLASLLGMEGGHAIENSLGALRAYYDLGARYMTLTHNVTLDWADAALDEPRHHGLTPFGKEVVREMNRLGMLVDISHVSPDVMRDALEVSAGVAADADIRRIEAAYTQQHGAAPQATLQDVADHIDHVARVAGHDHVGLAADFDGEGGPAGLEDVSKYPGLFAELIRRGWSDADLKKLAGENVLRVFTQAEQVAKRLQQERPPSIATIGALDGKK